MIRRCTGEKRSSKGKGRRVKERSRGGIVGRILDADDSLSRLSKVGNLVGRSCIEIGFEGIYDLGIEMMGVPDEGKIEPSFRRVETKRRISFLRK